MTRVLITNPAHDDITRYLFVWSRDVKELAESKGFDPVELSNERAIKSNFEASVKKINPSLIIFHGHGSNDYICGYGKDTIIVDKANVSHLKNCIVHCVTCKSCAELGDSAIQSGCKTFIGFKKKIFIPYNPWFVSNPMDDKVAGCSIEPMMALSKSLLKGNTAKESYERSQAQFLKWIEFCNRSDAPIEVEGLATWLNWSMINQDVIGDKAARI